MKLSWSNSPTFSFTRTRLKLFLIGSRSFCSHKTRQNEGRELRTQRFYGALGPRGFEASWDTLGAFGAMRSPLLMALPVLLRAAPSCFLPGTAYEEPHLTAPNGAYVVRAADCQTNCELNSYCEHFTWYNAPW